MRMSVASSLPTFGSGRDTDNANGAWECEEFYLLLNKFEDTDFSPTVEREQQEKIADKLRIPIGRVRSLYDDLTRGRGPRGD